MLFFSECAAFDRLARNAVRVSATSPAYGEDTNQSCAAALDAIEEGMGIADKNYLEASVSVASESFAEAFQSDSPLHSDAFRHGFEVLRFWRVASAVGAFDGVGGGCLQAGVLF